MRRYARSRLYKVEINRLMEWYTRLRLCKTGSENKTGQLTVIHKSYVLISKINRVAKNKILFQLKHRVHIPQILLYTKTQKYFSFI